MKVVGSCAPHLYVRCRRGFGAAKMRLLQGLLGGGQTTHQVGIVGPAPLGVVHGLWHTVFRTAAAGFWGQQFQFNHFPLHGPSNPGLRQSATG